MKFLFALFLLITLSHPAHAIHVEPQFAVKQQITFSATSSSTKALDQNFNRNYLFIQNEGSVNITVKVGSAESSSEGVVIQPGGGYEFSVIPTDAIYIKAASGTQSVNIIEGNAS